MSNLAQGRALKGISGLSPSPRLTLGAYPLLRRLKLPPVFQQPPAGPGKGPLKGLTSLLHQRGISGGVVPRVAGLLRQLGRIPARSRPPPCGCPIHASFARRGPFSWDAFGRCSCGLPCLETLEPRPGPPCLSNGPGLAPLGYAIGSALLAGARRRLETLVGGALALQLVGGSAERELAYSRGQTSRLVSLSGRLVGSGVLCHCLCNFPLFLFPG